VRGRAAEGGRGPLTNDLEFELGKTPDSREFEVFGAVPRLNNLTSANHPVFSFIYLNVEKKPRRSG
jgi:hypothetical protein